MGDPGVHDPCRDVVVTKRVDQDLSASRKLAAEDPVRPMSLVEGAPFVCDRTSEVHGRELILEPRDSFPVCASKEKPDHHVVEAPIDEILHDCSQHRFAADIVEVAHLRQNLGQARLQIKRRPLTLRRTFGYTNPLRHEGQ